MIKDAAAVKETAEVRLRVLLLHDDDDMNPSLLLIAHGERGNCCSS